ncbi:MAG TPA: hypothetical protein VFK17_06445 [Gaiellaceae bacterium]|nr:hypothetical protein [Gaiellaceae bacterium]
MTTQRTCRRVAGLAAAGLGYRLFLRRRLLDWGATRGEAAGALPGDELLPGADVVSTRAITIAAPPSDVWPWLVQMGPGERGGAYSYDWIENLLRLDMHSVDRVLPQFQHVEQGDVVPDARGRPWLRFDRVEPERVLAARSPDGGWVWSFVLVEQAGWTRLLSRNRIRAGTLGSRLGLAAMIPGSLVMERKMLHGIKERAERLAAGSERETERTS